MTTKKLILYTAIVIGLLWLATVLTGCAPCDWQATNCPIQEIEKEVLKLGFILPLGIPRFSRRKTATFLIVALTFVLSACTGNKVAHMADPVQNPIPVTGAQPVSLR